VLALTCNCWADKMAKSVTNCLCCVVQGFCQRRSDTWLSCVHMCWALLSVTVQAVVLYQHRTIIQQLVLTGFDCAQLSAQWWGWRLM
jgi:hypothetical protein